ncbi:MAG: Hydroxylamine reductase [Candidatus Dichloromethanomonas elyunquensis]|nr:MAG: Hydroxylamine reductase [Candidatus Dichloromethanomonas elyunquensis]
MPMFCLQCQETAGGKACTKAGVCGKAAEVANLQDLLLYVSKGISYYSVIAGENGIDNALAQTYPVESLFMTLTNVNFDKEAIIKKIREGLRLKNSLQMQLQNKNIPITNPPDAAAWTANSDEDLESKAVSVGVLATENEDVRSLRALLTYGIKGMAAYYHHAFILGFKDTEIISFIHKALAATLDDCLTADDLVALILETGKYGVTTLALLDQANTTTYGSPEITSVNTGVRQNPGILISGHDLKDLDELLQQTEGTGVDVYTHGEMLPSHYYPAFKKYSHFVGNYGNAWWKQAEEFEKFNGPILMTTNCLVPPKDSYKDRLFTTSIVGFEGIKHIPDRSGNEAKDFEALIEMAKKCLSPTELESGNIVGGFAHQQVLALADKVIEAVKAGAIKKFVVMAGCDGRMKSREYYADFAAKLPQDTVILTAGCAKYRYNKLNLGDIGGIPRVLDAGQCNDSYSLAVIALKLKEVLGLEDINQLPIIYNIAWYEQKAVLVLLALLYLGVKNIRLGPTLPAFLSPNVVKLLVETFGIGGISSVEDDLAIMLREE